MRDYIEYFTEEECHAAWSILMKIAAANARESARESESLITFATRAGLRPTPAACDKARKSSVKTEVARFQSRRNLSRLIKLCRRFAKSEGMDPDSVLPLLGRIDEAAQLQKKEIRFSPKQSLFEIFRAFSYLWGQKEIHNDSKELLAILFTITACLLGSFWTTRGFFGLGRKEVSFVLPQLSAVLSGLAIFLALMARGYLPKPFSFKAILFFFFDLYLLSVISMHILGRGNLEKSITFFILLALILLLWLGMRELVGFFFLGLFALLIYKIVALDTHFDWRALPFCFTGFLGISFQSSNFFDDVAGLTVSFAKKAADKTAEESSAFMQQPQLGKTAIPVRTTTKRERKRKSKSD